MNTTLQDAAQTFGRLVEPTTLKIVRRLPGPPERLWRHLTDHELRRQWLAAGTMPLQPGATFELTWRNDELSASAAERPAGHPAESRANCRLLEADPPRRLRFEWPGVGEVSFELEPVGDEVLLTVLHRRLPDPATAAQVGAGWHAHLDLLAARTTGGSPPSFWAHWQRLHGDYAHRFGG